MAVLDVRELGIEFAFPSHTLTVVDGVSFRLEAGQTLGIVGESGSGKSLTLRAIMHALPSRARIRSGSIVYTGIDITRPSRRVLSRIRGREIAMILQDPITALNPVLTIEHQICETLRATRGIRGADGRKRAVELLDMVEVPDPERLLGAYAHQLSGGLAQRVVIAIALSSVPSVLLADEPTTALDVTVQAQILSLLKDLRRRLHMSMILVSHDMGVIAQTCERIAVMYAGRFVEQGGIEDIFQRPRHPYTVGLLASVPRIAIGPRAEILPTIPGAPPQFGHLPRGCPFRPRCPLGSSECEEAPVPLIEVEPDHRSACLKHSIVARDGVRFDTRGEGERGSDDELQIDAPTSSGRVEP